MLANSDSRNVFSFTIPSEPGTRMRFTLTPGSTGDIVSASFYRACTGVDRVHQTIDISLAPAANVSTRSPPDRAPAPPNPAPSSSLLAPARSTAQRPLRQVRKLERLDTGPKQNTSEAPIPSDSGLDMENEDPGDYFFSMEHYGRNINNVCLLSRLLAYHDNSNTILCAGRGRRKTIGRIPQNVLGSKVSNRLSPPGAADVVGVVGVAGAVKGAWGYMKDA